MRLIGKPRSGQRLSMADWLIRFPDIRRERLIIRRRTETVLFWITIRRMYRMSIRIVSRHRLRDIHRNLKRKTDWRRAGIIPAIRLSMTASRKPARRCTITGRLSQRAAYRQGRCRTRISTKRRCMSPRHP